MESFIVIGDTHGYYNLIIKKITIYELKNISLFHVGDFGVGFNSKDEEKKILENFNEFLKSKNVHLYVIRGNHDNPIYFNGEFNYSNLHLLPDYSVVEVSGVKILMVGGAVSVDRNIRTKDYDYWLDEKFNYNEDKVKDLKGIDYVITHSSPNFVHPFNDQSNGLNSHGTFVEHYVKNGDFNLKNDLNKERNDITKLYNLLIKENNIKKWWYGHFHSSEKQVYNNIEFILLNVNEIYHNIIS